MHSGYWLVFFLFCLALEIGRSASETTSRMVHKCILKIFLFILKKKNKSVAVYIFGLLNHFLLGGHILVRRMLLSEV